MEKYGYLHCRIRQRHRRSFSFLDFREGGANSVPTSLNPSEGNLPPCTPREVRSAIKQYQKKYHLPETGKLDRRTKELMSTSRCGNADKGDDVVQVSENIERTTSTNDVLNQFIKHSSEKISNNNPSDLGDSFQSRPWKRSVSNSLLNVLSGTPSSPSSSLERRKRYLHNYINRLKTEDPMLYKNNEENKIIDIRKRSVAIAAEEHIDASSNSGNIPKNLMNQNQKFDKPVIKWRLLESGYSSRIPVEDQRATIDLAFRMWSEVIPLNFAEEVSGDIASVDIEVAFGTGKFSSNCCLQI